MSHIFDALQRAESESAGTETPTFSVATDLLQAAEQKIRGVGNPPARVESVDLTPAPSSFDELERCPVLQVSIPADTRLVVVGKEESLAAEKFRFLGVRLRQLRQTRPLKKILITSSIPQEGKSTVAANLACTLARRKQHKTLVLESDLRRPNIVNQFGVGKLPGLCEWLSGKTDSVNICKLEGLGLWI